MLARLLAYLRALLASYTATLPDEFLDGLLDPYRLVTYP
jgi:hypothetical protein